MLLLAWAPQVWWSANRGGSTPFTEDRGLQPAIERTDIPADSAGMAKKPEPPKPTTWTVYKLAAKAVRLGRVEALDEAAAIEKGAAEFKVPGTRLMAIRQR